MPTIADNITRLQGAKADLKTAIEAKGVTVPSATKIDGYATLVGQIPTGSTPNLQSLNVTPTTSAQQITPTSPVDGYDEVNVAAVTSAIDPNIVAGNIKKDVSILGVMGTYEGSGVVNPTAEPDDVIFIDYDGTIRYSYSASDFANLSELPANPSHPGLTAQGWNWTLAGAKAHVARTGELVIGQSYITDDGKTRLHISIDQTIRPVVFAMTFNQSADNGVRVDWGDGSASETFAGTGNISASHTYNSFGDFVISFEVVSGTLSFNAPIVSDSISRVIIHKVECGSDLSLGTNAFQSISMIKTITLPTSISLGNQPFLNISSLLSLTLPYGQTTVPQIAFQSDISLRFVSLPETITRIGYYAFSQNAGLTRIDIPSGVTQIETFSLNLPFVASFDIPSGVTSVAASAFSNNTFAKRYIFRSTTPPTLANVNAFTNIPQDCKIYVPNGSGNDYKGTTNWSTFSSQIYELDANGNIPS